VRQLAGNARAARRGWQRLLVLVLLAACSGAPIDEKRDHLRRGDAYLAAEKYPEAIIEYRNVLQREATVTPEIRELDAAAIRNLGRTYCRQGQYGQALPLLIRASELLPDALDVRLLLGETFLVGNRADRARPEALFVLERRSGDHDALALLAESSVTDSEVEAAMQCIRSLGDESRLPERLLLQLGRLHLRRGELDAAETYLNQVIGGSPERFEAHMALAELYTARSDLSDAESEYEIAASLAPTRSTARIQLAEFYLRTSRLDDARRVLTEITERAPDFLPAWLHLATLSFEEEDYAEAERAVLEVLERDRSEPSGLMIQGRLDLARGEPEAALRRFKRLSRRLSRYAPAHYYMARARLELADDSLLAMSDLREAIALQPDFDPARQLLAELNLEAGFAARAIDDLERVVARHPNVVKPALLLGQAYLRAREFRRAEELLTRLVAAAPGLAEAHRALGMALTGQGKVEDGRRELERALELAPDHLPVLETLVKLDLAAGRGEEAADRVRDHARAEGEGVVHQLLLARVSQYVGDHAAAVVAYRSAIEHDPLNAHASRDLVKLIRSRQGPAEALVELRALGARYPQNADIAIMSGMLLQELDQDDAARTEYERALELGVDSGVAANNLAQIELAAGDYEQAVELARTARRLAPTSVAIADTLGWSLHQAGRHREAYELLAATARRRPTDPDIQYHFGMVLNSIGELGPARAALERALLASSDFVGADAARAALSRLPERLRADEPSVVEEPTRLVQMLRERVAQEPGSASARLELGRTLARVGAVDEARTELLEASRLDVNLAEAYHELLALMVTDTDRAAARKRLAGVARELPPAQAATLRATLRESAGELRSASRELERARKLDANAWYPSVRLAEVRAAQGELAGALELAQAIRAERPWEPLALATLGWILHLSGEVEQAAVLLEDAAQRLPSDPRILARLGQNRLQRGQHATAREALATALDMAPRFQGRADAERALRQTSQREPTKRVLIAVERQIDREPEAAMQTIEEQLATYPESAPLRLLEARALRAVGRDEAAGAAYAAALELDHDLFPAYEGIIEMHRSSRTLEGAEAAIVAGLTGSPGRPDRMTLLGLIQSARGRSDEAAVTLQGVVDERPGAVAAKAFLAVLRAEQADPQEGLRLAQAARRVAPDDPYVGDALGWTLYHVGQYRAALGELLGASQRLPGNAGVRFHLAMTYARLGQRQPASEHLEEALRLSPDLPGGAAAREMIAALP